MHLTPVAMHTGAPRQSGESTRFRTCHKRQRVLAQQRGLSGGQEGDGLLRKWLGGGHHLHK